MKKQRLYLVARETIVSGSVYQPGTIFLVAVNDNAQGGYHARAILQPDIESEADFEIEYGNGTISDPEMPIAQDYEEYCFVPGFPVDEYTNAEEAVSASRELNEESSYIS